MDLHIFPYSQSLKIRGEVHITLGKDSIINNMTLQMLVLWGCMPEVTRGCMDMTNASSTYLSIVLGAIVGGLITWWVYKIQNKTTAKQDETLRRIGDLEESHDMVLKSIQSLQQHQEKLLNRILSLEEKINSIVAESKKHD